MEIHIAPYNYDANALVTYKSIKDGEITYPTLKVNQLEVILDNPTLDVIESMPNGEHIVHQMKRTDVSELFRQRGFHLARIERQESQIGKVLDNLTAENWYASGVTKEEILSELCEIFEHEPKQEVTITATVQVEVKYDCPLEEIEDFDARDFLQDVLTIDAYHGDVIVDSFDVDYADWTTS